jgi:hypothetical protein
MGRAGPGRRSRNGLGAAGVEAVAERLAAAPALTGLELACAGPPGCPRPPPLPNCVLLR